MTPAPTAKRPRPTRLTATRRWPGSRSAMPSPPPLCPCGRTPIGFIGVCLACLQRWLKEHPPERTP